MIAYVRYTVKLPLTLYFMYIEPSNGLLSQISGRHPHPFNNNLLFVYMAKNTKISDIKIKFKPAGDRVLVAPDKAEDSKTASGIIIPDTASKEKPETGKIVAVGEGKRTEDGIILPMQYKVGDKIMFSKYGYDEVSINDTEYYVISESNILGTF